MLKHVDKWFLVLLRPFSGRNAVNGSRLRWTVVNTAVYHSLPPKNVNYYVIVGVAKLVGIKVGINKFCDGTQRCFGAGKLY